MTDHRGRRVGIGPAFCEVLGHQWFDWDWGREEDGVLRWSRWCPRCDASESHPLIPEGFALIDLDTNERLEARHS